MCHVCGFIHHLCVELKLMINTRSLPNQVLKSVHPLLLSSRCWPWGVFIKAGHPIQHGEVRDSYLAWVRPVDFTSHAFLQVGGEARGPFYLHGLALIPAWVNNYIHYNVWDEITYPFPNFKGCIIEVWEWIRNFILHFIWCVITYPCWD